MDDIINLIMGIIIFLFLVKLYSMMMGNLVDLWDGWLYNGLLIFSIVIILYFIIKIPFVYIKEKESSQKTIKENLKKDAQFLAKAIRKLESTDIHTECPYTVPDEPLQLSLDEQYEYLQSLESGKPYQVSQKLQSYYQVSQMNYSEMEQRLEENIEYLDSQNPKSFHYFIEQAQSYEWIRLRVMKDEYYQRFKQKFNTYFPFFEPDQFKKCISDFKQKVESLKNEKTKRMHAIQKGVLGEKRILDDMKFYLQNGHILSNVRIEYEGYSAESDIIYVGPTGVYSLEIKNFGENSNWQIRISKDGQWIKVFPDGTMEPMKDVGSQVNYHVAIKERFINDQLKERFGENAPNIKVKSAVVIANDNVIIDNKSDLPIFRLSALYRFLEKDEEILDEHWQEQIAAIFHEYKRKGKSYEIPNFNALMENLVLESIHFIDLYQICYGWLEEINESQKIV